MKGLNPDRGFGQYPWIDDEGISHQSKLDFVLGKLDFCGCGSPEVVGAYLRDQLSAIASGSVMEKCGYEPTPEQRFFWYWADAAKLTEHGGSVPGWLSDKGEQFLLDLFEALEEETEEEDDTNERRPR